MPDTVIEKKISNLVELQFPEFFRTDGPQFVLFVKKYFEWLEGISEQAIPIDSFRQGACCTQLRRKQRKKQTEDRIKRFVSFSAKNNKVVGTGTFFTEEFKEGERIALYQDHSAKSYDIFTIDTIESDNVLYLTLDKLPDYSSTDSIYGTVYRQKQTNYHIRRLPEYDDVDTTSEHFMIYFKEAYLKNIQFTTKTNTRQLIKHSLDLYRAKGTPRALDLLFRLVFGVGANVYSPSQDIFKLSDGNWFVPQYLEVNLKNSNTKLVNKEIIGLSSGASAFCTSVIRKTVKGKLSDIIYISNIKGNFIPGETINSVDFILSSEETPSIKGSLAGILVPAAGTGSNYSIGDIVEIRSNNGQQASARVVDVISSSGVVDFSILNGGYGYKDDSEVIISDKVLVLSNISPTTTHENYFEFKEELVQPYYNITYISSNNFFSNGSTVNFYHSNNDFSANAVVIGVEAVNSSVGSLKVIPFSFDSNVNTFFVTTTDNSVVATISTADDLTAKGTVVGEGPEVKIIVTGNTSGILIGEKAYQTNTVTGLDSANGIIGKIDIQSPSNSYITLTDHNGVFKLGSPIRFATSNKVSNTAKIDVSVGVMLTENDFISIPGNKLYGTTHNTNATVASLSQGAGATFDISSTLQYSEEVELNTDLIADYADTELDAEFFLMPGDPTANIDSTLLPALSFDTFTIGKVLKLINLNKGAQYNLPPIVRINEDLTKTYKRKDKILFVQNQTLPFSIGELVSQEAVESRGLVIESNSTSVTVELLRISDSKQFVETTNSTTLLIGENSGATANITLIEDLEISEYVGFNAQILAETTTSANAIVEVEVQDSGIGFVANEPVEIFDPTREDDTIGVGNAILKGAVKGKGYYKTIGGFLSDEKKLFDGLYYQNYSYDIRSSITLNKYEDMLKQLLHIPGTKYFSTFVFDTVSNVNVKANSKITIE